MARTGPAPAIVCEAEPAPAVTEPLSEPELADSDPRIREALEKIPNEVRQFLETELRATFEEVVEFDSSQLS